jgi:hypothetical protein
VVAPAYWCAHISRLQGEPATGVSDVHFHPVEPRALRATLALTY